MSDVGTMRVKSGLAEMLKGGVIMDVVDAEQAKIAEEAGACAVMALYDFSKLGALPGLDPPRFARSREDVALT